MAKGLAVLGLELGPFLVKSQTILVQLLTILYRPCSTMLVIKRKFPLALLFQGLQGALMWDKLS